MPPILPAKPDTWLSDCLPDTLYTELTHSLSSASEKMLSHGDYMRWQTALNSLPNIQPSTIDLSTDCIRIGHADDLTTSDTRQLTAALQQLHPWRKGPFDFFGIYIDTEWRSDWKWKRLEHDITALNGRRVLDIGCGSGYHCWRMLGAGAQHVIGIDPTILFAMQFYACQQYIQNSRIQFWPLGIDDLPENMACFDSVFSMGILYHRRSPIDHLLQLKSLLAPGGELILETLVIDGEQQNCLIPEGRYAKMRNVWFIPSVDMLRIWLQRAGFKMIKTIDITATTQDEQRTTPWMRFESLADYLHPENAKQTVEGYPAPQRAILTATI